MGLWDYYSERVSLVKLACGISDSKFQIPETKKAPEAINHRSL